MGDHRASIKITFEMHGVKRECDMWVNYIPESDARGVGESVFMFFEKAYADAMQAWYEEIDDYEDRKKAEKEREEVIDVETGEEMGSA